MPTKIAVAIPTYKDELNALEKISLAQCRKILGRYPLIFFAPEGKNFSYVAPNERIIHFPPEFFRSVKTYSKLMMSPKFYEAFGEFDYILIHQLDAFVFYDALENFCRLGYDFIGAPWPRYSWSGVRKPKTPQVGNGGFSLRKVSAFQKLLTEASRLPSWKIFLDYTEDAFFGFCGVTDGVEFSVAPVEIAKNFSMEHNPARHLQRLKNLPFGCHNWHKFSADFYVELFARFGWDLRPVRNFLGTEDFTRYTPNSLANLAMERLVRRAERGLPIARCLPLKKFSAVRVLRNSNVLKVLSRLILEENSLADKIFFYDERDWRNLVADMEREPLPQLVLTLDDDAELIDFIERRGLIYGRHVVSFQREILHWYEKFFHNLGR